MTDVKPQILIPVVEEDEGLDLAPNLRGSMLWSLRIPQFLMERWERVREDGIELGTLVVDNSTVPPRVSLRLPDTSTAKEEPEAGPSQVSGLHRRIPKYDTTGIPDEYEVYIPEERSKNTWVFNEKVRDWTAAGKGAAANGDAGAAGAKRKRDKGVSLVSQFITAKLILAFPKLVGAVQHECTVRPTRSAKYLKILDRRRIESEQSKRPIIQIEDSNLTRGQINQLASGFSNHNSRIGAGLVSRKPSGVKEKFARMDRTELTDRLFTLFAEKPYWSIGALRLELEQPDAWLREVLPDLAEINKEGKYKDLWQLKESWGTSTPAAKGSAKMESQNESVADEDEEMEEGDEDEESVDDEEFEEVTGMRAT